MAVAKALDENKVAHATATHNRLATHKWRHKVKVKDLFVDDASHEAIDAICKRAVVQIKAAIDSENARSDQKDDNEREYFVGQLESVMNGFDMMIGAVEGETVDEREDNFNYVLSELYDVGDMKIELQDGKLQKFLWVD